MTAVDRRALTLIAVVILGCVDPAMARGKTRVPAFDVSGFSANEATARWLLAYDFVAWKATDVLLEEPDELLKQLGREWFCFKDSDGLWHAVFGQFDPDTKSYRPMVHYVRHDDSVVRTDDAVDAALAARYGGAIHSALGQLPAAVRDLGVTFNHYVRPIESDKLEVWFLPSLQQDNTLVFGGDLRFVVDPTGSEVLEQQANFKAFRGIQPSSTTELVIDRQENELPSVGDIFVILQFGHEFKSITISTHCYLTRMLTDDGKDLAWFHAERSTKECTKKASKRSTVPKPTLHE